MNLQSTMELLAGGPGSGCNPEVGRCGRQALGFVSPNEAEGMNFKQALSKMRSPEQQKMVQEAHMLLGEGAGVQSAVGEWTDGAENSSVLTMETADKAKMDYVTSKLGLEFNQKQVISFVHDEAGKDVVWTMHADSDMGKVRQILDKVGIAFRTLVPEGNGVTVHVFDPGGELGDNVDKAAEALGTDHSFVRGNGEFIGGDTREEGRSAFSKIIAAYEKGRSIGAAAYRWFRQNQSDWFRRRSAPSTA